MNRPMNMITPGKIIVANRSYDVLHLVCPICKKEDPAAIDLATLQQLALAGETSICIDCDATAAQPIEFWPVDVPERPQEAVNA